MCSSDILIKQTDREREMNATCVWASGSDGEKDDNQHGYDLSFNLTRWQPSNKVIRPEIMSEEKVGGQVTERPKEKRSFPFFDPGTTASSLDGDRNTSDGLYQKTCPRSLLQQSLSLSPEYWAGMISTCHIRLLISVKSILFTEVNQR